MLATPDVSQVEMSPYVAAAELESLHQPLCRCPIAIEDLIAVALEFDNVALLQKRKSIGHRSQGQRVRSEEVLANADAKHQGATHAGSHYPIRSVARQDGHRVCPFQPRNRGLDRLQQGLTLREMVIDRALATGTQQLELEDLKVIVLMVFWSLGEEPDALVLDELCDDGSARLGDAARQVSATCNADGQGGAARH